MLVMPIFLLLFIVVSLTAFLSGNIIGVVVVFAVLVSLSLLIWGKRAAITVVLLTLFCLSTVTTLIKISFIENLDGQKIFADFVVTEEPIKVKNGQTAIIKVNSGELPFNAKMQLSFNDSSLKMGGRYRGYITVHSATHNKSYYYPDGVYASANLKTSVSFIGESKILISLNSLRNYIKSCLYANMSQSEAATLNAITVGEKAGFSKDFEILVRRSGTSHIMVVSGMHFAIIMNAVFTLSNKVFNNKYFRAVIALLGVLSISALCGFTMSILRAGLTYVIIALAPLFKRDYDAINTLCFTVILIMMFSPFAVFSVSLQLTFLSTLGILALTPDIMNRLKGCFKGKALRFVDLLTPLVMTICASVMTLPVIIYCFGEVSIMSPITNLLVSFAVTLALLSTAAAIILKSLPFVQILSVPVFDFANIIAKYINDVISCFGSLPNAAVTINKIWWVAAALIDVLLILYIIFSKTSVYLKLLNNLSKKENRHARNS